MYRVARELDAYFSHIYRKARKLECLGVIAPLYNGKVNLYTVTALGCLLCMDEECTNPTMVLRRLAEAWGVGLSPEELMDVVKDLEEVYRPTDPVNDASLVAACLLVRKWPRVRPGTGKFIRHAINVLISKMIDLDRYRYMVKVG